MAASIDPFKHHPNWRSRIVDPRQSRYRKMSDADIDRNLRQAGVDDTRRLTNEQRETNRQATLQSRRGDEVWIFGCGSLIWDPSFLFDEVRLGTLNGFHRRFCLHSVLGRGSPEKPGLMVAFDSGAQSQSAAFRIPRAHLEAETRLLWRREMQVGAYQPCFVPVSTAQGEIDALAFVANPSAPTYRPHVDHGEAAALVATGEGFFGTCFEYVENLARQLAAFGIDDAGVRLLYQQACDIRDAAG